MSDDEKALLPQWLTFMVAKLAVGAWESWLITDRVGTLDAFLDGGADAIVARAFS